MAVFRVVVVVLLLCYLVGAQYDVFMRRFEGMPFRVLQRLASRADPKECREEAQRVLKGLQESSLWAATIMDASAQGPPSGFLRGSSYALGNFEQCVHSSSSKYCLASIRVQSTETPHNGSVWELLQEPESPLQIRRNTMYWGLCIPVSCKGQDLQWAMQGLLEGGSMLVYVSEDNCHTQQQQLSVGGPQFAIQLMVMLYILFLAGCTWSEHYKSEGQPCGQNPNKRNEGVTRKAFSVQNSWKRLTKDEHAESSNINCIHGLRFVLMFIVILGHRGEALMSAPLLNREVIQEMFSNPIDIFIMNSQMIVDIFFVMSGFLATWQMLKLAAPGYKMNLFAVYLHRYLRLTGAYVVAIVFHTLFLYDLGTGPLWKSRIGPERDNCVVNWWSNLLYINNHVNPSKPCVDQAWYLACDMQLYLVAPFLLAAARGQHGVLIFSTAMALSVIVPATVTYIKDLDPTIIPYPETLGHTAQMQTYSWAYIPAYARAGPYFVGMASALWLHKLQSKESHISKGMKFCGWVLAPLMSLAVTLMGLIFYHQKIGKLWSAVYAGLHRTVFSLPVAFGITASALGNRGPVYNLLSWKVFQPLSRLTYSMFLCHGAIQLYHIGSLQHPQFLSMFHICWSAMADTVASLIVATVLYITVESPLQVLLYHYVQRWLQTCTPETIEQQESPISKLYGNETIKCKSLLELCSSQVKAILSPQYAFSTVKQKNDKNK